ncbi:hypothetical protein K469DRAFT_121475 [Zopfia rhizophila CBS 207.26]|uniref:Uncharacterized protein n=1 Tax=Zopfia rhizophila CBS 207.26 TaxID=1314779 RepID=A0A6A6E5B0_9PEZI|nr:hypothetical protein K469DRAFT_121475 [Zopfia rhizophila CBS 207.26]
MPRLCGISQLFLIRVVWFPIMSERASQFIRTLEEHPDLRTYVHWLELEFYHEDLGLEHRKLNEIHELLPYLREIWYNGQRFNPWSEPHYFRPIFLDNPSFHRLRKNRVETSDFCRETDTVHACQGHKKYTLSRAQVSWTGIDGLRDSQGSHQSSPLVELYLAP